MALLNVSLPSTEVVCQFVGDYQQTHKMMDFSMGEKRFAEVWWLDIVAIQGILKRAQQSDIPIDFRLINQQKENSGTRVSGFSGVCCPKT